MKPGLCKKTGYSCRGTFITLIKCLVLTMAFFFLGISFNSTKVEAVYFTHKNLISASPGISSVSCRTKLVSPTLTSKIEDTDGCMSSEITIDSANEDYYMISYGIFGYGSAAYRFACL